MQPPPCGDPRQAGTPYAGWLIAIFHSWYPKPQTGIRLFDEIMQLLLGHSPCFGK